jgi:Transglycosylase SLT domain/SPOR domain
MEHPVAWRCWPWARALSGSAYRFSSALRVYVLADRLFGGEAGTVAPYVEPSLSGRVFEQQPARGLRPGRAEGTLSFGSRIIRRRTVLLALGIAGSLGGTLTETVGKPAIAMDLGKQANVSSSLEPQSSQRGPAQTAPTRETSAKSDLPAEMLCNELGSTARENDLPVDFFIGLIWQESRFNTSSVSRAGAQGIAQFMPATARERQLANPFEPIPALREAARLLSQLRTEFGNLGLAAAAYNAGPRRVRDWLAGLRTLPGETRAYVEAVTGRSVEEWAGSRASDNVAVPTDTNPCSKLAGLTSDRQAMLQAHEPTSVSKAAGVKNSAPWGLQLIGDSSEVRALSAYRALQKRFPVILGNRDPLVLRTPAKGAASWYRVRVAETSLQRANQACERLKSAGGSCLVQRNE